jgi:signal recognition particle receptor subunit beta
MSWRPSHSIRDLYFRMEEAKDELMGLLGDDKLRDSPLLVLANKQDLPEAASPAEVTEKLELYKLRTGRDWFVQRTSAVTGEGLVDGLTWCQCYKPFFVCNLQTSVIS